MFQIGRSGPGYLLSWCLGFRATPGLARFWPGSFQSRPSPVLISRLAPPFSLPLVPLAPSHLINTGALMVLINLAAAADQINRRF